MLRSSFTSSLKYIVGRARMSTARVQVAQVGDLQDGTMKEVPFPKPDSESKILLSKIGGQYYASSSKCTHYGAPLAKGVLTGSGRVTCPWHGACFNVCTGDIEDAPGLDALQSFKVETEGDAVFVTAPSEPSQVTQTRKPRYAYAGKNQGTSRKGVVVVGGGAAAAHAVEALRESGYQAPVKVISSEPYLPIDRTKLSKAILTDPTKAAWRNEDFYKSIDVDFVLGKQVQKIDFKGNKVEVDDGSSVEYEYLIVATGGSPNRLPLDGGDLNNIFQLRTLQHTQAIDKALGNDENNKKNLVVVGSSFIGMELANAASKRANVTVVGMEEQPFQAILGKQVGAGIRKNFEKNGIKFQLPASLSKFKPSQSDSSAVGSVELKDGTSLPADVVVLGVGVKPQTTVLKESGVEVLKDQSVAVDSSLRLKGHDNVFAVGDIATWDDVKTGKPTRVEHWNVASNHARSVAHTIMGGKEPYNKTAIFWSAAGAQLRYCGSSKSKEWEDVIVQGNPDELKFIAYYTKGDEIVAVATMGNDPLVSHCAELYSHNKMLSRSDIHNGKSPFDVSLAHL